MKVQSIAKSLILLCLSVFIISVSGCKDPESPSPSVHVVGYVDSSPSQAGWKNTDKVDAYFWKNSDGSKLPSDTLYVTRATGIFFEP